VDDAVAAKAAAPHLRELGSFIGESKGAEGGTAARGESQWWRCGGAMAGSRVFSANAVQKTRPNWVRIKVYRIRPRAAIGCATGRVIEKLMRWSPQRTKFLSGPPLESGHGTEAAPALDAWAAGKGANPVQHGDPVNPGCRRAAAVFT
jgi:hypothetical protein